MPKITCEAIKCYYNAEGLCSKDSVKIEGSSTTKNSLGTCCESYENSDKCSGGACNLKNSVAGANSIECDATNCHYNEGKKCTANGINVIGHNADKCSETSCETFKLN